MHVCFGNLDFIITMDGELARAPIVIQPLHSADLDVIAEALEELRLHAPEAHALGSSQLLGFDYGRLECQLSVFLGSRPSQENLRHLTFSFANVMARLTRGEPLSPEYLPWSAPTTFLFGLRNVARTIGHLVAQRVHPSPMNNEFVGTMDYVMEYFYDLLVGDIESISDSDSSRGSHHPSQECFMAGTPEGCVESIHEGAATPTNDHDDDVKGDVGASPRLQIEQLRAWHKEIEDARL